MNRLRAFFGAALLTPLLFLGSASAGGQPKAKTVFKLEKIRVERTRSLLRDTLHVSLTVKVGAKTYGPFHKHLGDHRNGTVTVNLATPPIEVSATDKVVLNYVVLNSGHKKHDQVQALVTKGVTKLLDAAKEKQGAVPDWRVEALSVLAQAGLKVIFANCDGVVAADQIVCTGDTLTRWGVLHRETRFYPGSNSPRGCGSNSKYHVTWAATR
jgi:hypothetical protein